MKQFSKVQFKGWFINKMKGYEAAASINPKYQYEIIKETEKAICFEISLPDSMKLPFTMWCPKSAIISF